MTATDRNREVREPTLVDAVIPLVTVQVTWVLCAMVAAVIVLKDGHGWEEVQAAGQRAVSSITSPVLSVCYGFTGFMIERLEPADED